MKNDVQVEDRYEVPEGGFEAVEYDVSCCCEPIFCGYTKLFLGPEEVDKRSVCCGGLADVRKRLPYGELSGVEKQQCCGCITTFSGGNLDGVNDQGGGQPFCPGFGCSESLVDEVVKELKRRQTARGDAGNIMRLEKNTERLEIIERKLDALLNQLNIQVQSMDR